MHAAGMADQTIAAVRRFSRFYTRQLGVLDEGLLHSSFTLAEVRVMYEITHGEEVSAVDLTEQLRLDPGYVSRILRKLEKLGLVERKQCSDDRRRSILAMTSKGEKEFGRLDIQQDRDVAMLLSGVGSSDQKQLMKAMRLVEETLGGSRQSKAPVRLRWPEPGDLGWIAYRFSRIFWEEYRYDQRFEGLVAKIISEFIETPSERQRCWIAEQNGEVLGAVLLMCRSKTVAQLRLLYVEPHARGQGLGTQLVEAAIGFAREAGYRTLMLWTQDEEKDALRLYERLGFTQTSARRHRDFSEKELNAVTLELKL